MRAFRLLSARLLLLVMAFAMAPQPWLHACEHEGSALEHVGDAALQAHCALCDTGALLATEVPTLQLGAPLCRGCAVFVARIQEPVLGFDREASARGPPVWC